MKTISQVTIAPGGVKVDGREVSTATDLGALYRQCVGDYPKFFKMDGLCKLGFLGAELLLGKLSAEEKENAAVILFNRSGSLVTDRNYQKTIGDTDYFPSPALFVYTLANIVTGEIGIRHKIYGETSFYIMDARNDARMDLIVDSALTTSTPSVVLTGWLEYDNSGSYLAELKLVKNTK